MERAAGDAASHHKKTPDDPFGTSIGSFMCEVVRLEGFEPPTHCLEGSCSIQLS